MGSVKSQIGWLARGGDRAQATFDEHQAAIGELQRQVAELQALLDGSADDLRRAMRAAVDDLSERIAAVTQRLDAVEAAGATDGSGATDAVRSISDA